MNQNRKDLDQTHRRTTGFVQRFNNEPNKGFKNIQDARQSEDERPSTSGMSQKNRIMNLDIGKFSGGATSIVQSRKQSPRQSKLNIKIQDSSKLGLTTKASDQMIKKHSPQPTLK